MAVEEPAREQRQKAGLATVPVPVVETLRRPHAQDRGDSDDTWGNTALHCNTMQYNTALH